MGSPSSFDNEEPEEGEHDIHTMRGELAVMGHAHRDGCREVEGLKECLLATETTLGATNREAAEARSANLAACAELTGELNSVEFL